MFALLDMVTKEQLGEKLRNRRVYLGMTQQEVAVQVPTSRPNYTKWESGEVDIAVSDLQRLTKILKVSILYFLPDEEHPDEEGVVSAYYRGLPPDKQSMIRAMMQAAHEDAKRSETTHGRKAE